MNEEAIRTGTINGIGDYIYWNHEGLRVGYLLGFTEHLTKGDTVAELEKGLVETYKLVTDIENL